MSRAGIATHAVNMTSCRRFHCETMISSKEVAQLSSQEIRGILKMGGVTYTVIVSEYNRCYH